MLWTNNCNYKPKNNEKFSRGWVTQILKANKDKYICIDIVDEEKEREGFELCGDLFFRLVNIKGNNQICRFAMNTSFVDSSNKYTFDKTGVDPDSIAKDKKFDNDFKIELIFKDCCSTCKASNPVSDLCNKCRSRIKKEKIEEWEKIAKIIDQHHNNIQALMTNEPLNRGYPKQNILIEMGIYLNFKNKENCNVDEILRERRSIISCEVLSEEN